MTSLFHNATDLLGYLEAAQVVIMNAPNNEHPALLALAKSWEPFNPSGTEYKVTTSIDTGGKPVRHLNADMEWEHEPEFDVAHEVMMAVDHALASEDFPELPVEDDSPPFPDSTHGVWLVGGNGSSNVYHLTPYGVDEKPSTRRMHALCGLLRKKTFVELMAPEGRTPCKRCLKVRAQAESES